MKKIIVLCFSILLLLLLASCIAQMYKCEGENSVQDKSQTGTCHGEDRGEVAEIEFHSGIYHDKNWEETEGSYQYAAIPNQEIALNVAIQVFEGIQKSTNAQKYVPYSVFYDEQDAVWIVSFCEPSDEIMLGGDCNIAIQKEDGKILRIWFGE